MHNSRFMPLLTPDRVESDELLDEGNEPLEDVERSLRDLRRLNRYCGGVRAYRLLVRRLAGNGSDDMTVLDLGTGTSDLVESLGARTRAIGLDLSIDHLRYGARLGSGVTSRIAGDAASLPFRDGTVDVVTSSHFFHHFAPDANAAIIEESLRVARIGVAITDTRRHYAPLVFCKILGWTRLVGRITRFDAPASVLRGYTIEEARQVAAATSARRFEVARVAPYRLGMVLWK